MKGLHGSKDLLEFAQELVRIQSYSGQEEPIARRIAGQMRALGYDEVNIDRYGNVLGRVGDGPKAILFDSHMDTVKVLDETLWQVPPFSGQIVDGCLWGRGAVDMKTGLAASVYAAALAKKQGWLAGKRVYVSCSIFEEDCDGEGLKHLLEEAHLRPDYAIICEPSSNVITTGHKGKAQIIIQTQGISAHGSAPEKGSNAIYEMAEIIQRVEQTEREFSQKSGPRGTVVMSQISSTSVSLNAVPSACEAYLDRRMAVGETEQTIREEMARIVQGKKATWKFDLLERTTWTGETITYQPFHLAWQINVQHELAQALIGAYSEVMGHAPERFGFWDYSTNAVAVVPLGIPTIGFGPGDAKLAHMRDEKCETAQIVEACAVYAGLIARL